MNEVTTPEIDENAIFQFLVKRFSGHCVLSSLRSVADHLICPGSNLLKTLARSSRIKLFKAKNQDELETSLVLSYFHELKMCLSYNRTGQCDLEFCPYIHICRRYITNSCRQKQCRFSHNMSDERNMRLINEKNLAEIFSLKEILYILRRSTPHICNEYNRGSCTLSEKLTWCPQIHICRDFIEGRCLKSADDCGLGHSFNTPETNRLLSFFGLARVKAPSIPFAILIADDTNYSDHYKGSPDNAPKMQRVLTSETLNKQKRKQDEKQSQTTNQTVPGVHVYTDDKDRRICEAFIVGKCKFEDNTCIHHHYQLPYLWQIKVHANSQWSSLIAENEQIEASYCDARQDDCSVTFKLKKRSITIQINSDDMSCISLDGTVSGLHVRRLTTRSYVNVSLNSRLVTHWLWYWLDDGGIWKTYEIDNAPYQDLIEAKFVAGVSSCFYERANFRYVLDLPEMYQKNLDTGNIRKIRRRPVFIGAAEIGTNTRLHAKMRHVDQQKLPAGWVPMNTEVPTTPEFIPLKAEQECYTEVAKAFSTTMDMASIKILNIMKVQNLVLWEKFQRKKNEMEQYPHLRGDAQERLLFHGTSTEDAIRCISKQGFDWRVCGKNATLYGCGSYFATDASYSDDYTDSVRQGRRFMFYARVLVGAYTRGDPSYTRPPKLDFCKPDSDLFNSCVNEMGNPSIFVIFHEDQAYPEYLIEFEECTKKSQGRSGKKKT